jgi:c-di-GMP-binding flagellar brake protein YcgR
MRVAVQLPDRPQPIQFTGDVVWCEQYELVGKAQTHRSVLAGVKFLEIAPEDQQEIMRYVILSLQPRPASSA